MSWLHAVIDVPSDQHAAAVTFWSGALGWPIGQPWQDHQELRSFEPPAGTPYVHVQQIDGPPRQHVDLESATPDETVAQAVALGAVLLGENDRWRTLRSPGGLPFCVLRGTGQEPPSPVAFPDGHRVRAVQVCLDSPRSAHAGEVAFWRAVLPGRWVSSGDAGFAGKWHDDQGSPLQLLFQELRESDGSVRAHLDLGTDDLPAEVGRLLELGAADVGPGRGWHVLRDAVGQLFCVTENSPDQTWHRELG
jgi:hypothetical protein